MEIDDDDTEGFDVDFDLPKNIDDDNTYYLYIKVNEDGDEDEECNYERVRIDFERDDDDVMIDEASISPTSNVECEDNIVITVEVESIGTDDQEDVRIEVENDELDIDETTSNFDLGDHDDNDNDYKSTFSISLPDTAEAGTYYIDVQVYDKSGDLYDSELLELELGSCPNVESDTDDEDDDVPDEDLIEGVDIEMLLDNDFDVEGKDELTIPIIIQNRGDEDSTITLSVDDVDWGNVEGTEYLSNINAGQSLHAYVYLNLETDVTGVHDLTVEVQDGTGTTTTEVISLDFGEEEETTVVEDISEWNTSLWYWIIGIIVLVIILIILVRLLTK